MDDAPLVLAMPRRELFRIQGFTARVEPAILGCIAEESWFADPATLAGNLDAKEVRLGLLVRRAAEGGSHHLVAEDAVLLHIAPIPAAAEAFGRGLAGLRRFALGLGTALLGRDDCRIELIGYCNQDALAECRTCFLLVYRLHAAPACAAPAGMAWVPTAALGALALDPVSALVAEAAI